MENNLQKYDNSIPCPICTGHGTNGFIRKFICKEDGSFIYYCDEENTAWSHTDFFLDMSKFIDFDNFYEKCQMNYENILYHANFAISDEKYWSLISNYEKQKLTSSEGDFNKVKETEIFEYWIAHFNFEIGLNKEKKLCIQMRRVNKEITRVYPISETYYDAFFGHLLDEYK